MKKIIIISCLILQLLVLRNRKSFSLAVSGNIQNPDKFNNLIQQSKRTHSTIKIIQNNQRYQLHYNNKTLINAIVTNENGILKIEPNNIYVNFDSINKKHKITKITPEIWKYILKNKNNLSFILYNNKQLLICFGSNITKLDYDSINIIENFSTLNNYRNFINTTKLFKKNKTINFFEYLLSEMNETNFVLSTFTLCINKNPQLLNTIQNLLYKKAENPSTSSILKLIPDIYAFYMKLNTKAKKMFIQIINGNNECFQIINNLITQNNNQIFLVDLLDNGLFFNDTQIEKITIYLNNHESYLIKNSLKKLKNLELLLNYMKDLYYDKNIIFTYNENFFNQNSIYLNCVLNIKKSILQYGGSISRTDYYTILNFAIELFLNNTNNETLYNVINEIINNNQDLIKRFFKHSPYYQKVPKKQYSGNRQQRIFTIPAIYFFFYKIKTDLLKNNNIKELFDSLVEKSKINLIAILENIGLSQTKFISLIKKLNINIKDEYGNTLLMSALKNNKTIVVNELFKEKFFKQYDIYIKNDNGETAFDIALNYYLENNVIDKINKLKLLHPNKKLENKHYIQCLKESMEYGEIENVKKLKGCINSSNANYFFVTFIDYVYDYFQTDRNFQFVDILSIILEKIQWKNNRIPQKYFDKIDFILANIKEKNLFSNNILKILRQNA